MLIALLQAAAETLRLRSFTHHTSLRHLVNDWFMAVKYQDCLTTILDQALLSDQIETNRLVCVRLA